jgi:uncharacterized protein (TIGR00251 family)
LPAWLRIDAKDGSLVLNLHIQPGAKKTEVVGPHGDALKLRLAAPPVDGKANAALLAYLGQKLGAGRTAGTARAAQTAKPSVELVAGQTSRAKRVRVTGATPAEVQSSLSAE